MIIDFLCWIGIIIAALFGIGVLLAIWFVVAAVAEVRHERKQ